MKDQEAIDIMRSEGTCECCRNKITQERLRIESLYTERKNDFYAIFGCKLFFTN